MRSPRKWSDCEIQRQPSYSRQWHYRGFRALCATVPNTLEGQDERVDAISDVYRSVAEVIRRMRLLSEAGLGMPQV